jgi:hypothetical protein
MKCLFTTSNINGPSTVILHQMLSDLNNINRVSIDFFNNEYENYDVVFFMGYDPQIEEARLKNKHIKIGIIDIRPSPTLFPKYKSADFILVNGIEMKDWALNFCNNIFTYYLYPVLFPVIQNEKEDTNDKIIIGYHGNKVHLMGMYPRITRALDQIGEEYDVELWAMYNIDQLGKWNKGLPESKKIRIKHIPWSNENYSNYISKVDIGIIPNLIPSGDMRINFGRIIHVLKRGQKDIFEYSLKFKSTSNAGRIFVFAQFGIPVISDMFPSALQLINDKEDSYVCNSTASWHFALKQLVGSDNVRKAMGKRLQKKIGTCKFLNQMNQRLITFIDSI